MLIKIILEQNKTASEVCNIVKIFPQVLVNAKVDSNKKDMYKNNTEIIQKIESIEKEFSGNGRTLIRPSGTEPLIRVMIEGEDINEITKRAKELVKLIEEKLN